VGAIAAAVPTALNSAAASRGGRELSAVALSRSLAHTFSCMRSYAYGSICVDFVAIAPVYACMHTRSPIAMARAQSSTLVGSENISRERELSSHEFN
jgi:hypothetical protein